MQSTCDVMVITPHPDDAELGAGGTIARWVAEKKRVMYVVCTSGDKGTSDPAVSPEMLSEIREREQLAAAELLGVGRVIFLRYPDQGLEDTPTFRKQLVGLIRTWQPATILTTDPYRRYICHRDHRMTGQAVLDAVFPYARDRLAYPDLIAQGLPPHRVQEVWLWNTEDINLRIDISATFDLKYDAVCCHASQLQGLGSPGLEERLRNWCRKQAAGTDYEMAEAFHQVDFSRHPA